MPFVNNEHKPLKKDFNKSQTKIVSITYPFLVEYGRELILQSAVVVLRGKGETWDARLSSIWINTFQPFQRWVVRLYHHVYIHKITRYMFLNCFTILAETVHGYICYL